MNFVYSCFEKSIFQEGFLPVSRFQISPQKNSINRLKSTARKLKKSNNQKKCRPMIEAIPSIKEIQYNYLKKKKYTTSNILVQSVVSVVFFS